MGEQAEARVAQALRDGVAALREGRPRDAHAALSGVVTDRDFVGTEALADIVARSFGLAAQAALQCNLPDEAERLAVEALRRARVQGDSEGIADVTELLATIRERRAKRDGPDADALARGRAVSLDTLRAIRDPAARAEALLRRCQVALHDKDTATVTAAAALAAEQAQANGDPRVQVLAHLCAAHAEPHAGPAHLDAALRALEHGGPEVHALVTAVARTAEQLGVVLPKADFAGARVGS